MKKLLYSILVLSATLFLTACSTWVEKTTEESVWVEKTSQVAFDFTESLYDFGLIKQSDGKVKHTFTFRYNGDAPIEITGVPTSCACTSATIDPTVLQDGDEGTLTVTFNPNLHEEPVWKFFKTISLLTEPSIDPMPEIKIRATIDLDLGPDAYELQSNHDDEGEEEIVGYNSITPQQFTIMQKDKDFLLIDVHIPEQDHITGTDLIIPYDAIEKYEDQLPADKNAKIVVYCRSGGMSRAAAYILAEHGYTNVYDLVWGKIDYDGYITNL